MSKQFKPNLGVKAEKDQIKFPAYKSWKKDGIRCICGLQPILLSRSLKPIRNELLQDRYADLCNWCHGNGIVLDGELFSSEMTFQAITSHVMKSDRVPPEHLEFHVFDVYLKETPDMTFKDRYTIYKKAAKDWDLPYLEQVEVNSLEEVDEQFKIALANGDEGLIIRSPDMPYKFGRSTVKEGGLLKIKPFETFDGKVKGVIERMENTSESYTNETGHSQKHRCKEDMVPTGIASAFVIDWYPSVEGAEPVEMKVTLTGVEDFRRDLWTNRDSCIGQWIEFKAMNLGIKDALRHPTFERFREEK